MFVLSVVLALCGMMPRTMLGLLNYKRNPLVDSEEGTSFSINSKLGFNCTTKTELLGFCLVFLLPRPLPHTICSKNTKEHQLPCRLALKN